MWHVALKGTRFYLYSCVTVPFGGPKIYPYIIHRADYVFLSSMALRVTAVPVVCAIKCMLYILEFYFVIKVSHKSIKYAVVNLLYC